jgi:hypothetical protein
MAAIFTLLRVTAAAAIRHWRRVALAAGLVVLIALTLHWLPARQVRLHQRHLLTAVENRDWKRVREFLASDYRDRWNPSRDALLAQLPAVFQDFLACGILTNEGIFNRDGVDLVLSVHVHVVGSGGPIAQYLIQQSDALTQPFAFTWRRRSWLPWEWELVSVDQPELELPAGVNEGASELLKR